MFPRPLARPFIPAKNFFAVAQKFSPVAAHMFAANATRSGVLPMEHGTPERVQVFVRCAVVCYPGNSTARTLASHAKT